jgi:hypothetical protein
MDQGHRGPVTDCAMWSHLVVLDTPIFHLLACFVQIHEPVLPKTFESDGCIEAFGVGIVGWLTWPTEIQRDAVGVGPEIELLRGKLAALVDADSGSLNRLRASSRASMTSMLLPSGKPASRGRPGSRYQRPSAPTACDHRTVRHASSPLPKSGSGLSHHCGRCTP